MSWNLVDKSLVIQTILYFAIVINGLASVISAALSKDGFGGLCILYGKASCLNDTTDNNNNSSTTVLLETVKRIQVSAGGMSVCHFIIAINILVCIFYAFFNAIYHSYSTKKSAFQIRVGYQMWTRTLAFGSMLSLVLVMSSACMVTVGLSIWCREVKKTFLQCSLDLLWCSDTQTPDSRWSWLVSKQTNTEEQLIPGHYLDLYEITETTCWINVALWLIHIVMYIHRLFKQRYVQTSYQEPFTADFLDAFT